MQIKNGFEIAVPIDQAWKVLLDVQRIAPCMPGAELTEVVDPQTFKGKVSVRLGPVALAFVGTARIEEADAAAHRARVKAQGSDSKGRGGAAAVVTFALSSVEKGTRVDVQTDVNLSGAVAQYGRGVGIIQDVATQIVGQFAASLQTMLASEGLAQAQTSLPGGSGSADGSRPSAVAVAVKPPAAAPISGFALLAAALKRFLLRLVGRQT